MKLFKYEGYNLNISEEAIMLKPFRTIWDRDKTADKDKAKMELAFIYFMKDPRSDYQIYIDENERMTKIKEGEGMLASWKPDKAVKDAMVFYDSFKSEAAMLLDDIRVAITKLREYIKSIDLNATDNNGKPIYTLNTYTSTISQIPKLITSLDEAEKTIYKDIVQSDKVRGAADKAMFEDL